MRGWWMWWWLLAITLGALTTWTIVKILNWMERPHDQ